MHFTLMLWFSRVWMCYNRQVWPFCALVPPVGLYLCKSHHTEWQGIIKNCSESFSWGEPLQMSSERPTECKRVLLPEQTGATNAVNAFTCLLESHFYKYGFSLPRFLPSTQKCAQENNLNFPSFQTYFSQLSIYRGGNSYTALGLQYIAFWLFWSPKWLEYCAALSALLLLKVVQADV